MGILGAMHGKFQFTPLREGRPTSAVRRTPSSNFNSRPSARGDFNGALTSATVSTISIHAPPRGATRYQRRWNPAIRFQFTPLREGRHDGERVRFAPWRYFNSRPSARGDTKPFRGFANMMYFNSRPSARGDRADVDAACRHNISIHAPPRGATHGDVEKVPQLFISIHAPPRGATAFPASVCPFPVFQFTPLREGRRKHGVSPIKPGIFQFTPLREGRRERSAVGLR